MTNLLGIILYLLVGIVYTAGGSILMCVMLSRKYSADKVFEAVLEIVEFCERNSTVEYGYVSVVFTRMFWPKYVTENLIAMYKAIVFVCEER